MHVVTANDEWAVGARLGSTDPAELRTVSLGSVIEGAVSRPDRIHARREDNVMGAWAAGSVKSSLDREAIIIGRVVPANEVRDRIGMGEVERKYRPGCPCGVYEIDGGDKGRHTVDRFLRTMPLPGFHADCEANS